MRNRMSKTQCVSITTIDKGIQKPHRVCSISVVIKTVRDKHSLLTIESRDMAHISSNVWLRLSS
jgi:hypothetical protein